MLLDAFVPAGETGLHNFFKNHHGCLDVALALGNKNSLCPGFGELLRFAQVIASKLRAVDGAELVTRTPLKL